MKMLGWLILVLTLGGCATAGLQESRSWPYDPRIEQEVDALLIRGSVETDKGTVVAHFFSGLVAPRRCGDGPFDRRVIGCTVIAVVGDAGSLVPPVWEYHLYVPFDDRETLRHELRHVYYGTYHD